MVDGRLDGERIRLTFPTKEEAEREMRRLGAVRRRAGDRVAMVPPEQIAEWLRLEERCAAAGGTLAGAVDYWLASRPGPGTARLDELLPAWKLAKDGVRGDRHRDQVELHWDDFQEDAERVLGADASANEVTMGLVRDHVTGHGWSPATQLARLRSLSCVFGWAMRQGLVPGNPVAKVPKPELPVAEEVRFLSVPEARRLLRGVAALGDEDRDLLAYLVLGMFAGIRRAELLRTTVRDIDFSISPAEFIVPLGKLSATVSAKPRSRKRRVVILENACAEWLRWAKVHEWEPGEKLIRPNFRKRWDRAKAVLDPWPPNVLRHTFPSYHYALYRNEAELQAALGHDSKDTLVEHYRGLARRAEAEQFFRLVPGTVLEPPKNTTKPD